MVSCWVARDNLLFILCLFVCRIQQDVRSMLFWLSDSEIGNQSASDSFQFLTENRRELQDVFNLDVRVSACVRVCVCARVRV